MNAAAGDIMIQVVGWRRSSRDTRGWVLLPSSSLHLLPGQSDAVAEIATTTIQQPSQMSLDIVLILQ